MENQPRLELYNGEYLTPLFRPIEEIVGEADDNIAKYYESLTLQEKLDRYHEQGNE